MFFFFFYFIILKNRESIESIESIMNNVTQALNDLRSKANVNAEKERTLSFVAKQDSLKSKVQESSVTLQRTKDVSRNGNTFFFTLYK